MQSVLQRTFATCNWVIWTITGWFNFDPLDIWPNLPSPSKDATYSARLQPNRVETAEHLSKLTGQTTVVKEQVTTSGRGWSTNVSRSTHEVSRPLLTPDETMR